MTPSYTHNDLSEAVRQTFLDGDTKAFNKLLPQISSFFGEEKTRREVAKIFFGWACQYNRTEEALSLFPLCGDGFFSNVCLTQAASNQNIDILNLLIPNHARTKHGQRS